MGITIETDSIDEAASDVGSAASMIRDAAEDFKREWSWWHDHLRTFTLGQVNSLIRVWKWAGIAVTALAGLGCLKLLLLILFV
jgi:hypothetical protein